jgi:cytochrome b561
MQAVAHDAQRYDATTIFFHWATAVLVVVQWLGAQMIDLFPKGPLRVDARSVHIVLGLLIAAVLAARIVWRLTKGRRLPPANEGFLALASMAAHWGLYVLLAAMVFVGTALTWVRGDSIFNLFAIPAFAPNAHGLADQVQDVHAVIGYVILALAGLHAAAALVHRYFRRDRVLDRMLPGA